jgi:hypothetical protein
VTDDLSASEEKEIDGQIRMIDELLSDLQKRRKDLVEAKEAIREEMSRQGTHDTRETSSREVEILSSLQWKKFGPGKEGEWAFANRRDGKLLAELEQIRTTIDEMKNGQQLTIGEFRYKLSADGKFLNRFPDRPSSRK